MSMLTDELLTYLFDGKPHILAGSMAGWFDSSRRFTSFVKTFQDKIRKKIRVTQDPETILDLRLELETAYRLLQERTLNLTYEPQLAEKVRSPDFAVTFTTSLTFMLEVTRLRGEQKNASGSDESTNNIAERLADAICSKLRQLLPKSGNVLLVGIEGPSLAESDLRATMLRIQQRAERSLTESRPGGNPDFFQRYGFRDRADFFNYYYRMSEILIRATSTEQEGPLVSWVNPQAKYPLPSKVRTALYRSQGA